MTNLRVLHNGGGWITNIGNAFLDYGSMHSVREANPEAEIFLTSVINRWASYHVSKGITGRLTKRPADLSNVFNVQEFANCDYITQSGAFLASHWFELHGDTLLRAKERGAKIIFNGGGMTDTTYTEAEIENTRDWMSKIKPEIFISRDEESFKNYHDLSEHSYNGIDVAFFLKNAYDPMGLHLEGHSVLNFDKIKEPMLSKLHLSENALVVRTHHSLWHNFSLSDYTQMKHEYYNKSNVMISEIPEDYLNIYSSAKVTYSDRVHACIATLSYGNPARLFSKTPRAKLFERVGAGNITSEIVAPDLHKINVEKQKQVKFLAETMK
mgnify:FL=1|jgi:hypothetical protein